jgi:hypothetical protein
MMDTRRTERRRRTWRFGAWVWLGALLAVATAPVLSSNVPVAPEAVKAAFLFRFGEYIEWPAAGRPGPVIIAVLGAPAVVAELRRILPGRSLQGRPVAVRELMQVEQLTDADIFYIGPEAQGALKRTISAAAHGPRPLLVVTDAPDGLDAGAAINFVTSDRRIRFEVSPPAAAAEGVKLSSRLLAVAARVTGAP